MYEEFYNLEAEPFALSPDIRFCFSHTSFKKARDYIRYAIHQAEGFIVITGIPGTGKSTLIKEFLHDAKSAHLLVTKLFTTQFNMDDILPMVASSFGLETDNTDKTILVERLRYHLSIQRRLGRNAVLIVDEAQDLSINALEELRLLTNIEVNNRPLLQMILVGQPQLLGIVHSESMEQLRQRILASYILGPMNADDVRQYVLYRLKIAGWKNDPSFDNQIFSMISHYSEGIARRVNQICSRLLLYGFVEDKHRLTIDDMNAVIDELRNEQLLPLSFLNTSDNGSNDKIVNM